MTALSLCGFGGLAVLQTVHAGAGAWHMDALLMSAGLVAGAAMMLVNKGPAEKIHSDAASVPQTLEIDPTSSINQSAPSLQTYKELFDNTADMLAVLSPGGGYLYASPAWRERFGYGVLSFEDLISFESAFPPETQVEAAALLHRAKSSMGVESGLLRMREATGEITEFEASLSCRREVGRLVFIRCVFKDVTAQNRRARMLALQLKASQMVVASTNADQALLGVAEMICADSGWDFAALWALDEAGEQLCHRGTWVSPERTCTKFQSATSSSSFYRGDGLPGKVWSHGAPIWIGAKAEELSLERREAAKADGLISGWGMPIRVGNQVIAVMEFFAARHVPEDPEMVATVETICAPLGQFMARSVQEAQLHELHAQRESILNAVADGILGIDCSGNVDFANPAALQMLGYSTSSLAGQPFHSLIHKPFAVHCTKESCRIFELLTSRERVSFQETFYRDDKSAFIVELSVTPLIEHGNVTGRVVSFHDISQQRALDQLKNEFVSTVSHELRTPLTSIRGALGLLSAGMLGEISDKASNLLRIAVSNSDRLVRLINDILDLERLESGRAPLIFRKISLKEVAQHALDNLGPMADAAQVKLALKAEETEIQADPDRMLQVMTNLISNAIKFSEPGSVVTTVIKPVPEGVSLKVVDQGRGIPADKLESIFDRFQQVDASDSRQRGGTGLGLAICRTILQQHGGRIWAERNPERGATFTVVLPGNMPGKSIDSSTANTNTVLVCTASQQARQTISARLERNGYFVPGAASTAQSVDFVKKRGVDLILIDLSQPGLNVGELLRQTRGAENGTGIPVLMFCLMVSDKLSHMHDGWMETHAGPRNELHEVIRNASKPAHVVLIADDQEPARSIAAMLKRPDIRVSLISSMGHAIEHCGSLPPDMLLLDIALSGGNGTSFVEWLRENSFLEGIPLFVYSTAGKHEKSEHLQSKATDFASLATIQPHELEQIVRSMIPHAESSASHSYRKRQLTS